MVLLCYIQYSSIFEKFKIIDIHTLIYDNDVLIYRIRILYVIVYFKYICENMIHIV